MLKDLTLPTFRFLLSLLQHRGKEKKRHSPPHAADRSTAQVLILYRIQYVKSRLGANKVRAVCCYCLRCCHGSRPTNASRVSCCCWTCLGRIWPRGSLAAKQEGFDHDGIPRPMLCTIPLLGFRVLHRIQYVKTTLSSKNVIIEIWGGNSCYNLLPQLLYTMLFISVSIPPLVCHRKAREPTPMWKASPNTRISCRKTRTLRELVPYSCFALLHGVVGNNLVIV